MGQLELSRRADCGLLTLAGDLTATDRIALMVDAVRFVPFDEHLVIDLSGVTVLDSAAASALRAALLAREGAAEAALVSPEPHVTVNLVLADLDRLAPVLHTLEDALAVMQVRAGAAQTSPAVVC